jgi:hypothetical protein
MAEDKWAAAANRQAEASTTKTTGNVQNNTVPVNMDDPFAKQSEAAAAAGPMGGQWDPRVPFEDIEGRMVIMVPKSYRDDAPIPEAFNPKEGETREEYRVDLVVLDGGALEYEYNFKENKDAEPVKKTMTVTEFPHTALGQTVVQGQLIRALKGAAKEGKFLYGVMIRVPQLRDQKLYPTPEALAAARKEWIAKLSSGKVTPEPRYTWGLDERPEALTPERLSLAGQWWEQEKVRRLNEAGATA